MWKIIFRHICFFKCFIKFWFLYEIFQDFSEDTLILWDLSMFKLNVLKNSQKVSEKICIR